ncbi:MAG: DUF3551 domain-containing protein [Pseudolabrys sp.]
MRGILMTMVLAGFAATALPLASPARADNGHEPYAWCAYYSGSRNGGGTNCGFDSFAQCRATIFGVGGTCEQNRMYHGSQPVRRVAHRRYRG